MTSPNLIRQEQNKLNERYKALIERAYNLRQTDHEASDVSAYQAVKLLNKMNKLNYLARESLKALS
jgi:hypothetical protein